MKNDKNTYEIEVNKLDAVISFELPLRLHSIRKGDEDDTDDNASDDDGDGDDDSSDEADSKKITRFEELPFSSDVLYLSILEKLGKNEAGKKLLSLISVRTSLFYRPIYRARSVPESNEITKTENLIELITNDSHKEWRKGLDGKEIDETILPFWISRGLMASEMIITKTYIQTSKECVIKAHNKKNGYFDDSESDLDNPNADDDGTSKYSQGTFTNLQSKALEKPGIKDNKMKEALNTRDVPNQASILLRQLNSNSNADNSYYLSFTDNIFKNFVLYLTINTVGKNSLRKAVEDSVDFDNCIDEQLPIGFVPAFDIGTWERQFPSGTPTAPKVCYYFLFIHSLVIFYCYLFCTFDVLSWKYNSTIT